MEHVATANTHIPSPEEIRQMLETGHSGSAGIVDQKRLEFVRAAETLRQTPQELRDRLNIIFAENKFSPAEELVRMAMGIVCADGRTYTLTTQQRISILSDLQQYVMPKLKSVELGGKVEHEHTVIVVRYGEDGTIRQEKIGKPVPITMLAAPVQSMVSVDQAERVLELEIAKDA